MCIEGMCGGDLPAVLVATNSFPVALADRAVAEDEVAARFVPTVMVVWNGVYVEVKVERFGSGLRGRVQIRDFLGGIFVHALFNTRRCCYSGSTTCKNQKECGKCAYRLHNQVSQEYNQSTC